MDRTNGQNKWTEQMERTNGENKWREQMDRTNGEKKKGTEKIFEDIIVENFPNMGKEIVNKSRKCRESHTG